MKKIFILILLTFAANSLFAQNAGTIALNPPNTDRGASVMKALSLRASATEFDTASIDIQLAQF